MTNFIQISKLTELLHKVRENDITFIKNNLTPDILNLQNSYYISLLQYSVIYAKKDIVEFLFEHNDLNYNITNDNNWNVLHNAAFLSHDNEHIELYKYLLEKNVDPHLKNNEGLYPFQTRHRDSELCKKLWEITKPFWKLDISEDYENGICHPIETVVESPVELINDLSENKILDSDTKFEYDFNGDKKTVMLFCGQGSQKVGMLSESANDPTTIELNKIASNILGYDLLDVCINGPENKLNQTDISQPALLLASIVQFNKLTQKPFVCAGFSLGEYSALVASGAITFEDCIKLLKVRGEAMIEASNKVSSGMLSVVGLDDNQINDICNRCNVSVANYLFPKGRVLSGLKENVNKADEMATTKGALKTIKLSVSGGFHSDCMNEAKEKLVKALETIEIRQPNCLVYSNVTGKSYNSILEIKQLLGEQIIKSVRWEETINNIKELNVDEYMELGVGNQLKTMMKRIDNKEWNKFL